MMPHAMVRRERVQAAIESVCLFNINGLQRAAGSAERERVATGGAIALRHGNLNGCDWCVMVDGDATWPRVGGVVDLGGRPAFADPPSSYLTLEWVLQGPHVVKRVRRR